MTRIGNNLKEIRTAHRMTQKDLAQLLNVSAQAVSRWENDEVEPSLEALHRISDIFSITLDELFGKAPQEPAQPEVEIHYVEKEKKPILALCEICNTPIVEKDDIVRINTEHGSHVYCKKCSAKANLAHTQNKKEEERSARRNGWIVGGIVSAILVVFAIICLTPPASIGSAVIWVVLAILAFALISCCFLDNTFVGEMWQDIAEWGFVSMPGIIFSLDFDGLVFLIAAKVFFFILGIVLAVLSVALATALGLICGIFAFPFAIMKSNRALHDFDIEIERLNTIINQ